MAGDVQAAAAALRREPLFSPLLSHNDVARTRAVAATVQRLTELVDLEPDVAASLFPTCVTVAFDTPFPDVQDGLLTFLRAHTSAFVTSTR